MKIKLIYQIEELKNIFNHNTISVYGAGGYARILVRFAEINKYKINSIYVTEASNNPGNVFGVRVQQLKNDNLPNPNGTILICVREPLHNSVLQVLSQTGITNEIYGMADELYFGLCRIMPEYDTDTYERMCRIEKNQIGILNEISLIRNSLLKSVPQPTLQYFILNILDHCNLNCKGCNHFSSIANERYIDVSTIKRDLTQMYAVHGDVPRIGIMGGEPLLHNDIISILEITREIFKKSKILLSTNGTLINKMSDEFWTVCRNNNIVLRFTKYPISLDYAAMEAKALSKGVKVVYFNNADVEETFNSISMDIEGNQNPAASFSSCCYANQCVMLDSGKLYTCQVISNSRILAAKFDLDMPITEDDYIDIYKCSREEVYEKLSKPVPFCRFCNSESRIRKCFKWGITESKIEEWT